MRKVLSVESCGREADSSMKVSLGTLTCPFFLFAFRSLLLPPILICQRKISMYIAHNFERITYIFIFLCLIRIDFFYDNFNDNFSAIILEL